MGNEVGVVCLSFVAFWTVEVVVTGDFSGRKIEEVRKKLEREERWERIDMILRYIILMCCMIK